MWVQTRTVDMPSLSPCHPRRLTGEVGGYHHRTVRVLYSSVVSSTGRARSVAVLTISAGCTSYSVRVIEVLTPTRAKLPNTPARRSVMLIET